MKKSKNNALNEAFILYFSAYRGLLSSIYNPQIAGCIEKIKAISIKK
jgi:hypothetical protein